MPKGQGYSHGDSVMYGTTKSTAKSAAFNNSGGNMGKPVGDKGEKTKKGNAKSRLAADRYK